MEELRRSQARSALAETHDGICRLDEQAGCRTRIRLVDMLGLSQAGTTIHKSGGEFRFDAGGIDAATRRLPAAGRVDSLEVELGQERCIYQGSPGAGASTTRRPGSAANSS